MKFRKWDVRLQFGHYMSADGPIAIELIDSHDGQRVAVATVNIPEHGLEDDEILVKTWSENEGMMEFLEANGIAKSTGETVSTGYCHATKAKLIPGANIDAPPSTTP